MDWLSDTSEFLLRSQCCRNGELAGWLGVVMQVGALMSAVAYVGIIGVLHVLQTTWLAEKPAWALYSVLCKMVFAVCAMTHVCTFLAFRWPAYRLFAFVELLNGVIACVAVMLLMTLVMVHSKISNEVRSGSG